MVSTMAWIKLALVLLVAGFVNSDEFVVCPSEGRQIRCGVSQVVLIRTAAYGRLSDRSECGYDSGEHSCTSDVFNEVDKWCTGLQYCFLDEGFIYHLGGGALSCPWGTPKYLLVEYDCINVAAPFGPSCEPGVYSPTPIRAEEGYIAGHVTYNTDCGTEDSPWVLEAPRGYRIELDIIDPKAAPTHARISYGSIQEKDDIHEFNFGSGTNRNRPLYRSQTNALQIKIQKSLVGSRFIIHYRAFIHIGDKIRYLAVSNGLKLRSFDLCLLFTLGVVVGFIVNRF